MQCPCVCCSMLFYYSRLLYCFQKCKTFQNMNTYDESELDNNFTRNVSRIYKHSDKEVVVTRSDGRTSKVTVTYAEY